MSKIFIGVAWPYVNGDLHPGHIAGNFLPADIFARFQRYLGNEVLMVSGSDCYGTPITVEADKRHKTPEEIVDEYHPHHLELIKEYGISFDLYTKTSTRNHREVVQEMLVNLAKKNLLEKKTTKQYFSPEEDKFLPDRYVEGECSFCGFKEARGDQCENCGRVLDYTQLKNPINKLSKKPLVLKDTEHLFFNWPKLKEFLEGYVQKRRQNWKEWIGNEVSGWLKKGVEARAITRDINWGVEVPNDQLPPELQLKDYKSKCIYVWFDAVIGYLSAAKEFGQNWQEFWFPKNKEEITMYNFMGKDNVVFHALFWPGQLYGSYGETVKLPDVIAANQYLNLEGKKFSKSRGITIDSVYLAKTYGVDPVRFYLTYIMPENADADFSWNDFAKFNNSVLIGTFANFINRVLSLSKSIKPDTSGLDPEIKINIANYLDKAKKYLQRTEFKLFSQTIIELAAYGNRYIDKQSPWHKDPIAEEFRSILSNGLLIVLALEALIKPLIPGTYDKLSKMTKVDFDRWPDIDSLKEKLKDVSLQKVEPLFAKIESEVVERESGKLNTSLR